MNCDSDFVVYLVTCKQCRGQYIGKSQTPIKTRHSNHKREIRGQIGGLGHHFGGQRGCGYGNVSLQIIEKVRPKNPRLLADRELYWQHQLRAYAENGGQAMCKRKEY